MTKSLAFALSSLLLATACTDPEPEPEPEPSRSGSFELVSSFDVTGEALLPAPAYDAFSILAGLREHPTDTLVRVLDEAGVPLIDDLYASLPGPVQSRLADWIDGYVESAVFADRPVTQQLDEALALVRSTVTQFDLVSDLTVSPAGATHAPRALVFQDVRVELPEQSVSCSASIAGAGALAVGPHSFGLAYGEYVDDALTQRFVARYGTDLRGRLGQLFDCPALAASVAHRCVLSVCVGHAAELEAICESGLDEAAARVHEEIRSLRLDALRLDAGAATVVDDAVVDGTWQAQMDFSQGLRPVPASFVGLSK
jgi:hypothetical protein